MVENMPSKCKAEGCDKHARGGGHCIAHGGGRRCQIEGCDKHAMKGGHCGAMKEAGDVQQMVVISMLIRRRSLCSPWRDRL